MKKLLAMMLLLCLLPCAALAADESCPFVVTGGVEGEDWIWVRYEDIDFGALVINRDLKIDLPKMTISNKDSKKAVTNGGIQIPQGANVTLKNVNIDLDEHEYGQAALMIVGFANSSVPAMLRATFSGRAIGEGLSEMNILTLEGNNTLISSSDYAGVELVNGAKVTINGSGKLTVKGGKGAPGIGGGGVEIMRNTTPKQVIIESGTIDATGGAFAAGIGGRMMANAYIEIRGGTITARGGEGTSDDMYEPKMALTADLDPTDEDDEPIAYGGGAGIGGGSFDRNLDWNPEEAGQSEIVISGGTITAIGARGAAGIGGGTNGNAKVTISGGVIKNAIGGEPVDMGYLGGAGIGSGSGDGGSSMLLGEVEITGGTIENAKGGSGAAGIGGGAGSKGEIEISGGTVTAKAGLSGAGIGSGMFAAANVVISGGRIKEARGGEPFVAMDYYGGAGIGSGACYNNIGALSIVAMVEITGGTIEKAIGGEYASGIGGGDFCHGAVSMSGDALIKEARSGGFAPGIGGGWDGMAKVLIDGAVIELAVGDDEHGYPGVGGVDVYDEEEEPEDEPLVYSLRGGSGKAPARRDRSERGGKPAARTMSSRASMSSSVVIVNQGAEIKHEDTAWEALNGGLPYTQETDITEETYEYGYFRTLQKPSAVNLPGTGDASMLGAWIALLAASGTGLKLRRKQR